MHPKNFTVKDVMILLKDAKKNGQPVYVAKGPCGGCDVNHLVVGEPKEIRCRRADGKIRENESR